MTAHQMRDLFAKAVALEAGRREEFLVELNRESPDLAAELRRVLKGHADPLSGLEQPPRLAAPPIVDEPVGFPRQFGAYRLLRRVGVGGIGIVFEAEQDVPARRVAIKILHPGACDQAALDRFRHEVHALGRLDHPHIARVYEFSTGDLGFGAQPYVAMEYVEGASLLDHAARRGLSPDDRIGLLARVADAVHHMHLKGVVHRDLKPANVLVSEDGNPKVVDFGVASLRGAGFSTLTRSGEILGTPRYMSPEQVRGASRDVDPRTDIYALGVVAYELLGGRMPYGAEALPQVVMAIQHETPPLLGTIDRRLRDDVEHVVAKALEKDPGDRYQAASELADDLRRSLRGGALAARHGPLAARIARTWRRRRRRILSLAAAGGVLLVGALGVSSSFWQHQVAASRARQAERLGSSFLAAVDMARLLQQDVPLQLVFEEEGYGRLLEELEPFPAVWAETASVIGWILVGGGRDDAGEALLLRGLAAARGVDGPPGAVTVRCLSRISSHYVSRGRYREALELAIEGHEIASKLTGVSRLRRRLASQIADAYLAIDDRERADAYATRALADYRAPPDVLRSTLQRDGLLGGVLLRLGRIDEAELVLEDHIAWHERMGFVHAHTYAAQLNALAGVRFSRGDFGAAEDVFRKALEVARRNGGERSAQYLAAVQGVGVCLREQGRFGEAAEMLTRSLALRRAAFAGDHRHVADAMVTIANLYQLAPGTTAERVEFAERGLAMRERLGAPQDELAEAELAVGSLRLLHGVPDAALPPLRSAHQRYGAMSPDSWRRGYALALLAVCEMLADPGSPARPRAPAMAFEDAYRAVASALGPDSPWVAALDRWRAGLGGEAAGSG